MSELDLAVFFEGNLLQPEKDGYLGDKFEEGKRFTVKVRLSMPSFAFVLTKVNGRDDAVLVKNNSRQPAMASFTKRIAVKEMDGGVMATDFHENYLMVAEFSPKGKCQIREVAIISQDGLFFLTEQLPYNSIQFFRDENGHLVCPDLKWPKIVEAAKPYMTDQELPSITEYVLPGLPDVSSLRRQQGLVRWWSLRLGMGAILLDNKGTMARAHWKELPQQNGSLRALSTGQKIHFASLIPTTGVTGFKIQVKGITVLE